MISRRTLDFTVITDEGDFAALSGDWNRLLKHARWRNPFTSFGWTLACYDEHRDSSDLHVIVARSAGRIVGIAPMMATTRHGRSALVFIGDTRGDYLGFVVETPEIESAVFDHAARNRGSHQLILCNLISETSTLLATARANHINDAFYYRVVGGRFPSWTKVAAKRYRTWVQNGGTVTRLNGAAAAVTVPAIAKVEASSWKGQCNIVRFATPEQQRFLRRALSECDELELWLAGRGAEPLAFSIVFRLDGRVCFYQGAFDESARKDSLGNVLDYAAMKDEWESGMLAEYDFMSGRESYKVHRTNAERPMYRIVID